MSFFHQNADANSCLSLIERHAHKYVSGPVSTGVTGIPRENVVRPRVGYTDAEEKQILAMARAGKIQKQIADALNTSQAGICKCLHRLGYVKPRKAAKAA